MSIKRLLQINYLAIGIFLIVLALLIVLLYQNQQQLQKSQEIRYQSYLLADELRQSSDDLTKLARTYVATGDVKYEKMYNDILDIRNGKKPRPEKYERIYWDFVAYDGNKPRPDAQKIPLQELMKQLGFTEEEFSNLKQSQANSDGLVNTELIAMNAVKGVIDEKARNMMLPGESNRDFAIRILHDAEYHRNKANIMKPIDQFFGLLDNRTKETVNHYSNLQQLYLKITIILIFILIIIIIFAYILIQRKISIPLHVLKHEFDTLAEKGGDLTQEIQINSKDELGKLAGSINKFIANLSNIMLEVRNKSIGVAAAAQQLNLSSEQTTASANEVATAISEISTTVEQVNNNVQEISSASVVTTDHANEGNNGILRLTGQMQNISTSSQRASKVIDELSAKSQEIGQIIELITTIADQTNLLALNAAIEAARAGDHGRGFAVVAEEVRKLAEQSAKAAKQIKELINVIQSESQNAVNSMAIGAKEVEAGKLVVQEVGESFKQIIIAVQGLTVQIQDVASATEQMSAGVQNIFASTEEQTAAMEEVSSSADSLSKLAGELNNVIIKFKV